MTDDTTRLFGLEGVEVVSVEIDEDDNPMLALITAADQARYCCMTGPNVKARTIRQVTVAR